MFLSNRFTCFTVAVSALLLLAAPALRAQELQPLPALSAGFNLEGYAKLTDTVKKSFDDIPSVAFEISLPKTWVERSTLGQSYGELIRYDGPAFGDVRPYFSLKRLQMKRENTARHELIAYMLKQGFVLRSIKEKDERNVEALYVAVDDKGDSFAVRMTGRIAGPEFLLAEYGVPIEAWDTQRDEQTFAMNSFKFLKDSNDPIETRIERTYFKALRFYYPSSWVFEGEDTPADNRVTIRLGNKGDNGLEAGRIRLTLLASSSLKEDKNKRAFAVNAVDELKAVRKMYEDRNYIFGQVLDSRKPDLNLPVSFSAMDVYDLHLKTTQYETDKLDDASHELWLAVFKTTSIPQKTYVAELYTPSRAQDIYLWSINTRAFELILKSIQ